MATTALGTLTLDLAVRLSNFTEGMDQAARATADRTREMSESVGKFKDSLVESLSGTPIGGAIDSLNDKLGSISEAFGEGGLASAAKIGAASVIGSIFAMGVGLTALALQTAEADIQLERLAKRGKTSTENLQVLTAATASFGLEMDGVGDILADAQEKLGEFAANGGGGLVDTLELMQRATQKTDAELEIFGKGLSTLDSVDAIQAVVNEMELAGATTQEVRFVTESLASGLGDIIPLWDNNGIALQNYEEKLNEAGVIRTKESIEQSKILADETAALRIQFEGVSNQLVTAALPAMATLIEYFKEGTKQSGSFEGGMSGVGRAINITAASIVGIAAGIGALVNAFSAVGRQMRNIGQTANNFFEADTLADRGKALFTGFFSAAALASGSMKDFTSDWSRDVATINKLMDDSASKMGRINTLRPSVKTSFNSVLSNNASAPFPYRNDGIPYRTGAVDQEIVASRANEKDKEEAAKANTAALKANTAASAKATDKAAKSISVSEAILGGQTYTTIAGGRYGAARAGRPLGHQAVDFSSPEGTQLYAPEGGTYKFANTPNGSGGRIATLEGDSGRIYRLLHLLSTSIASGSRVEAGQPIAKSGNSGKQKNGAGYDTHLHIEVSDTNGKGKLNADKVKIGGSGTIKYQKDVAANYDKAIANDKRVEDEAKRLEEARKVAGQNAVKANLSRIERIESDATEAIAEAVRTLQDRPYDLIAVTDGIKRKAKKDVEDLENGVIEPFLTEIDKLDIIRDNKIFDAITNFGKGSAQVALATEGAIKDHAESVRKLEEDTLLPFMTELEKLEISKDNMIANVITLHGADSAVANKAIEGIIKSYKEDKATIEWMNGEAQRTKQALNNTILTSMTDSVKSSAMSSEDSVARLNMLPSDYEEWRRGKDKSNDYDNLDQGFKNREDEINTQDEKGDFLLNKEQRDNLLLEAHEEYLINKEALDNLYAVKDVDLAKQTAMAKLDLEQANVDALGSLAGALFGQQSTAARAAFLVSKAYTLQKILLDKGAAISSAWANTNGDIFAKAAAAAQAALANGAAAAIVNQVVVPSISGIAHGGLDYVPSESTYLLDKGERVLSPNQNKDLTSFLNKGTSNGGGDTNITITIDNNGGSNMSSDRASEVSKQMSLQIKNIVQATLRQEKRQGGIL